MPNLPFESLFPLLSSIWSWVLPRLASILLLYVLLFWGGVWQGAMAAFSHLAALGFFALFSGAVY